MGETQDHVVDSETYPIITDFRKNLKRKNGHLMHEHDL